ncbi:MAG: LysR family transcriptional regulator [Rhodobacteraceae bacterium]|nr:LysR family transcriptional regulator [Paracoccaceae bacterium]
MDGYLRHLANFARIVDAGSLTGAANQRGVSPSAMSDSVRILETHFGIPLLERRRSGVVPTGKGVAVHTQARVIVEALDRAMGTAAPRQETVKVSIPQEPAAFGWFSAAIAKLRDTAPLLDVVLIPEDRLEDHTRYARDLYVRVGRKPSEPGLTWLAEGTDTAILAAHPDLLGQGAPSDRTAVAELPLLRGPSAKPNPVMKLSDGSELRFAEVIQAEGVNTRIALARDGVGVVACLHRSLAHDFEAGRMIRLLPDDFALTVDVVISSPHTRPSEAVQQVADALGACL